MKKTASFQQDMQEEKRVTQRSLFYWVFTRFFLLQITVFLIVLCSLFFRVFPLEMQQRIINEAINLQKLELLYLYCGLYMGAVLLAGITKYMINVLQAILGQKILIEIRTELYRHILQLPLQFYRKIQPGTVISAMTSELNAIGTFLGGAISIPLTSILSFLVFLGFMFHLSPLLALLSVSIYPFEFILIPLLQRRYNRLNRQRIATVRSMSNVVNEAISGIHEIHSNCSYTVEEKRLSVFIQDLYKRLRSIAFVKYGVKFANNLFQSFGPFLLFLVGGYLAIHGEFTLGALVAFLSAYEKVYDPWKEIIEYYQSLQDAKVRYGQIMQLFDHPLKYALSHNSGHDPTKLSGAIALKQAGFTVEGGVDLLRNITMEIKPTEQVALVGFSGSGKSTLALLMAQLYDTNQGTLLLDEFDISTLSKEEISNNITMISQHPFIFTGTIRDNLLYGVLATQAQHTQASTAAPIPSQEVQIQVIKDVGLEEDILRFGFNSVLPPHRIAAMKQHILRMREIINTELREDFAPVIERYDIKEFLHYASIRDNLIFGDSPTKVYTTEALPYNKEFRSLLKAQDVEERLVHLGYTIAKNTVDLLSQFKDDPFFFQGSPMEPEELRTYIRIIANNPNQVPRAKKDLDKLLLLSLRFIPKRHNIVGIEKSSEGIRAVLNFRHYFLKEHVKIDVEACVNATKTLQNTGQIINLPQFETPKDFVPYCPSEYLTSHSVRDNLLFGSLKVDLQNEAALLRKTREVFDKQGLLDRILDIGLDFEVGTRGDRLSGGQKQKVAIARAFLRESSILIMDEATASLDNTSQARIQDILKKKYRGKSTVIAVIHRLDMTPAFDKIFVLKAGELVESGTYEQLMERKGAFYELAQSS